MSYWEILARATERMDQGDLRGAEDGYHEAVAARTGSPGRVFWTETVGDAARRLWRGLSRRDETGEATRWQQETEGFADRYAEAARVALDRAREALNDPVGGDPRARLDLFVLAVYLATASRLARQPALDPHPYSAGALAAALACGETPPVGVVPTDVPLAADARLDLVRRGVRLLESVPASSDGAALAADLSALLEAEHFNTPEHDLERRWHRARLADRHLGDPAGAVALYRDFLDAGPAAGEPRDEARLRAAEILANVQAVSLPVPRYAEAALLLSTGPLANRQNEARRRAILETVDRRALAAGAWASAAPEGETWRFVLWQGDQPRDVLSWSPEEDPADLLALVSVCAGRVVRRGEPCNLLETEDIDEFVHAVLEAVPPPLDGEDGGRHAQLGTASPLHPELDPDRLMPGSAVDHALGCGRLWLAVTEHVLAADPALRAGLRELARQGDRPAAFLTAFLPPELVTGAGLALTPLVDRANPRLGDPVAGATPEYALDPALAEHDVAVVSTGRPGDVLAWWGEDRRRWRLVLDDPSRREAFADVVARRSGRHTLIPPGAEVHDRAAALARLDDLLDPDARRGHDLLPLFHWCRLTETHNGDLLDFLGLRPRDHGAVPLYDAYRAEVATLPRVALDAGADGWAGEYVARARGSEVLIGTVDDLVADEVPLRVAWGVDDDREAAWVICDSPSVHWRLLTAHGLDPHAWHRALAGAGRAHLSLVLGGGFLRGDLETQLRDWLTPYGPAACFALADQRLPHLRLAGGGTSPDAAVEVGRAAVGLMQRLLELCAAGRRVHVLPGREGPLRAFLAAFQRGEFGPETAPELHWEAPADFWRPAGRRGRLRDGYLVVARLESLDSGAGTVAAPHRGWRERDAAVPLLLRRRRALCALEVCALLSRGPAEIDVADPRWWRSFPLDDGSATAPFPLPPAEAARAASGDRAEVYDLPEPDLATERAPRRWRSRGGGADPAVDAAVDWLRVQGWLDADLRGLPAGVLTAPAGDLPPGWRERPQRLVIGEPGPAWLSTLRDVAGARERGDLDAWLLVIADAPPAEATALRDAVFSPGACLPAHGEDLGAWHAVVWATPQQLADPLLRRRLNATPPRETWATDLRSWLPSAGTTGLAHAALLRFVLNELRTPATLHAGSLPRAWRAYFRSLLAAGEGGAYLEEGPVDAEVPLDLPPVPVGHLGHPDCACPGCGLVRSWRAWREPCPACGANLGRWLQPALRRRLDRDIWRRKVASLREREDLRQGRPLCVWVTGERLRRLKELLDETGLPWRRQRDLYLTTRDADAPDWLVCVHGDLPVPPPECHHALLEPPANEDDFQVFRRQAEGSVSLWYHPLELTADRGGLAAAAGAEPGPAQSQLVARFAAPPGLDASWRWRGWLTPRLVEILTGLPVTEARKILGVTSWLNAVYDDPAVTAGPPGAGETADEDGPRLLCRDLSSMEAEYKLMRLHPLLDSVLPVLLGSLPPGVVSHLSLDDLPLEVDEVELAWLDRFLLGESLTLPAGSEEAASTGAQLDNLLYAAARGVINGPRRRIGFVGDLKDVIANLHCQLDYLAGAFRTLFAPGDGGDVPGTVRLGEETGMILGEAALETGVLLGLWHVRGPGAPGEISADPAPGPQREDTAVAAAATTLLAALAREEDAWRIRLLDAWHTGFIAEWPAPPSPPRRASIPDTAQAHAVIASDLADAIAAGGPGLLVLEGLSGTGRLATIAQALVRAGGERTDLTAFCPDAATAVRFNLAWRRCGVHAPSPRVRFDADLAVGAPLTGETIPHSPATEVAVLLEAYRMGPAERFRLAQRYRLGVQIWTVEPVLATESWEHLFLTQPEAEDVRRLDEQRRQSRRVCEEVLDLAEQVTGRRPRQRPGRSGRGEAAALLTASLDDGMTHMREKQSEWGGLLWHAVAPVPADLEYLGRAAARMGWLPVYRWELDRLLLPGPLEFVAVARDAGARLAGDEAEGEAPAEAPAAALLPRADADAYRAWLEGLGGETEISVGRFHARLARAGWAESLLAHPDSRLRVARLADDFAEMKLTDFLAKPLLEAWRRVVAELPQQPPAGRGSPVLMLSTPEEGEGAPAGSLAYFCLGTEPPLQHYRVTRRAADRLLVLYKDRSPLTDDG